MDRLRLLVAAALLWLGAAPAAAQSGVCGTLTNCPFASVPFSGAELIYIVQNGVSKKTNVSTISGQTVPQTPAQALLFIQGPGLLPGALGPVPSGVPSWNSLGQAQASTALPNGVTATTQQPTDTSARIATDGFVAAALPVVNPISCGADPTGVADSGPAIRACIKSNQNLVFSGGTYLFKSLQVETQATSAPTSSGVTLHFASLPAGVANNLVVTDTTTPGVIPANTFVQSFTATTVTLSAAVTGGGVLLGDTIKFGMPCCSFDNAAVLVSGLTNFAITAYGATFVTDNSIISANNPTAAFMFYNDTNFNLMGITPVGNRHNLTNEENVGIELLSDVNFRINDTHCTGDYSNLGTCFAGDWLVNGSIDNTTVDAGGQCMDLAFLLHFKIGGHNPAFGAASVSGGIPSGIGSKCLGLTNDVVNAATNVTGYSFTESYDMKIEGFDASNFATGEFITTGTNGRSVGNSWHDNPGVLSSPGIGILISYDTDVHFPSSGVPPQDWTFDDSTFNNGSAVTGYGVLIAANAISNSDSISNLHFYGAIDNNTATGIETDTTSSAKLSNVTIYSEFSGAAQTTSIGADIGTLSTYYLNNAAVVFGSIEAIQTVSGARLDVSNLTFANLPTCNAGAVNTIQAVSNSNASGVGSPITGTGANQVLAICLNSTWVVMGTTTAAASGSVTSVGLADGSTSPIFTITGSPVTTSGTLTETLSTQTANTIFAGPTTGSPAQPNFRAMVNADVPSALTGKTYNGLTVSTTTGTLTITNAKTLTDTSAIGASILLGATGGGFSAYAGATCSSNAITALSAAGAATCSTFGTGVFTALGTAVNTNGGLATASTASIAAGAINVGAGSGTALTGVADVAAGRVLTSGGVGSNPAYSATPTLGASGTSGTLAFGNATSGTVTLQTVTGALGSATVDLPVPTSSPDTLALLATAQTFSATKTFSTTIAATGSEGNQYQIQVSGTDPWRWNENASGTVYWIDSTNSKIPLQMMINPTVTLTLGASVSIANLGAGAGNGALCGATAITSTGGAVTYDNGANCITSLRAHKTDIAPIGAALGEVMALRPDQFHYRPGFGDNGAHLQVGMIAEEVEKVDPRLAAYDESGKLEGVRYIQSVALAFRAIQEIVESCRGLHDPFCAELLRRAAP